MTTAELTAGRYPGRDDNFIFQLYSTDTLHPGATIADLSSTPTELLIRLKKEKDWRRLALAAFVCLSFIGLYANGCTRNDVWEGTGKEVGGGRGTWPISIE